MPNTPVGENGLHSINHESRLFVLPCGGGFTCLGFDVERARTAALRAELVRLGEALPKIVAQPGTADAWKEHQAVMGAARRYHDRTGCRFRCELTPQLVGLEGRRVEVMKDGERRRFIVGKSGGWLPIHLEIKTRRSHGGMGVWGAPFDSVREVA